VRCGCSVMSESKAESERARTFYPASAGPDDTRHVLPICRVRVAMLRLPSILSIRCRGTSGFTALSLMAPHHLAQTTGCSGGFRNVSSILRLSPNSKMNVFFYLLPSQYCIPLTCGLQKYAGPKCTSLLPKEPPRRRPRFTCLYH
jgi:hypothetical protein